MTREPGGRALPLPRVVILGCGNPSRGDDGLGPALMARVRTWVEAHPGRPITAVEDFQLQVEHTLDLEDRDLALFIDAAASGPAPVALRLVEPEADSSFTTHALSPAALLHAYLALDHGSPPPAFALAVRGHSFGLGEALSADGARSLEAAWSLLVRLLENPSMDAWARLCTPDGATRPRSRQAGSSVPSPALARLA